MADKVAGFAISSYLLLTFACLKDIGPWVQRQPKPFAIGAGVAGFVYIVAVWCLYFAEVHVLGDLPPLTDVRFVVGSCPEPGDRRVRGYRNISRVGGRKRLGGGLGPR